MRDKDSKILQEDEDM
jgi:hypothetical protein